MRQLTLYRQRFRNCPSTGTNNMTKTITPPNCPDCGSPMKLRETKKFQWRNGHNRMFYGCSRFPDCRGIRPSHPDGTPYGKPADKETKGWRIKAHAAFDKLWKEWGYKRPEAYILLQTMMGMSAKDAHISLFTSEDCQKLIKKIEQMDKK